MAQDPAIDLLQLDEGTYLKSGGQIRSWSYWSRYTVAAAAGETTMFDQRQGQPGWTLADTNMPDNGKIPNSQKFVVKAIGMSYTKTATTAASANTATAAAILAWLDSTVFSFNIQDLTTRFQLPLTGLMGSALNMVTQPAATQNDQVVVRSNTASAFRLERPISITANTTFSGIMNATVAAAANMVGDKVKIYLYGDLWSRA